MALRDLVPWRKSRHEGQESSLAPVRRDFERMMDELAHRWPFPELWSAGYTPRVDVSETDKEIQVAAELPGMGKEDIEVSLQEDQLVIRGEKKEEKKEENRNYVRTERSYGSFTRVIPLTAPVREEQVDAVFKDGVLKITLPKAADTGKGRIEIKTE